MADQLATEPLQLQKQLDNSRKKVDVDHFDITVRELVRMADTGELHRAPTYQRKFRWTEQLESKLIESIYLGLPVPPIFVATNEDGKWELVDGLQRVSTLMHYVLDTSEKLATLGKTAPLRLADLEELTAFNGTSFTELPEPLRLSFYKRGLRITALSDKSDPRVRFDVFERLNRGAVILTPQEVRACVYQGSFNDLLRTLADEPSFNSLLKLEKTQTDDGTKEELVLKFFAYFYWKDKFKGAVTTFLNDYMEHARTDFKFEQAKTLFTTSVSQLATITKGPVLRKNIHVTPLSQLEAIMVAAAEIIADGGQLTDPGAGWLDDATLVDASTGGTNTRSKFLARIDRAKELLIGSTKPSNAKPKARTKK